MTVRAQKRQRWTSWLPRVGPPTSDGWWESVKKMHAMSNITFFCPWDNQNTKTKCSLLLSCRQPKQHHSSITIGSYNTSIPSSAQKSLRGTALSLIHHIIHPFICSSYRQHIAGLFHNFPPVTTHSCLSSLPNHVVITTVVAAT